MRPVVIAVVAIALAGCSPTPPNTTVTVFAASSLTEAFDELAAGFESANPGTTVVLNYGGSSTLAAQISDGANADVFAAASDDAMARVAASSTVFATNALEIAVPPGNPGDVQSLADFARPELAIALCAVEVPCGAAANAALSAAGVVASIDTYEQDVKAVLTRVVLGEVDAALVYRTDVRAAGAAVRGIDFDGASLAVSTYPIANLTDSALARDFVDFVRSPEGQRIFAKWGFGAP